VVDVDPRPLLLCLGRKSCCWPAFQASRARNNTLKTSKSHPCAPHHDSQAIPRVGRRHIVATAILSTRPAQQPGVANGSVVHLNGSSNGAKQHLASPILDAKAASVIPHRTSLDEERPHHEHPPLVGLPGNTLDKIQDCVRYVRARSALVPEIVIVLGSGLGALADDLEDSISIPYADIPHFHAPGVVGHPGRLVLGRIRGVPALVLQGRFHYYEGHPMGELWGGFGAGVGAVGGLRL